MRAFRMYLDSAWILPLTARKNTKENRSQGTCELERETRGMFRFEEVFFFAETARLSERATQQFGDVEQRKLPIRNPLFGVELRRETRSGRQLLILRVPGERPLSHFRSS